MDVRSYPGMDAEKGGPRIRGEDRSAWIADSNRISSSALRQGRRHETKVGSVHVVIVSALFLVLFASTLVVGGHAAIDPLVQAALAPHDTGDKSAVVYTMPDGVFCRRVSFDNVTAQVNEGPIERCQTDFTIARERARPRAFSWRQ